MITPGKFSVTDVFDTNKYAHDPRNDFMNWTMVDTGTFDYAADAWGYTLGARSNGTGPMDLARWPVRSFQRAQQPGPGPAIQPIPVWSAKSRNAMSCGDSPARSGHRLPHRGRMGSFADAIGTGAVDRRPRRHRRGAPLQQPRRRQRQPGAAGRADLGVFARAGSPTATSSPTSSPTRPDRRGRLSLSGNRWGRPDDTVGLAGVVNAITSEHEAFLNAGGLGILVGDGLLPHPGPEQIIETYYSLPVSSSSSRSIISSSSIRATTATAARRMSLPDAFTRNSDIDNSDIDRQGACRLSRRHCLASEASTCWQVGGRRMAAELDGPRLAPRSGRARQLVVFLHGYGADGNDLIGLAPRWQRLMPTVAFVAPNAPERCPGSPGYQWFPISRLDPKEMQKGVEFGGAIFRSFSRIRTRAIELPPERLALVGFSQGTMMSLQVGLRRAVKPAAIVGYSGVLAGSPPALGTEHAAAGPSDPRRCGRDDPGRRAVHVRGRARPCRCSATVHLCPASAIPSTRRVC